MNSEQLSHTCPYCASILSNSSSIEIWDTVILETDNFVVTPTKGSIVPGWLLVTPKSHIINLSKIPNEQHDEFYWIQDRASKILSSVFGSTTFFEHGPVFDNSEIGCGINHAHLHIVNLHFSLYDAVEGYNEFRTDWEEIQNTNFLSYLKKVNSSYLYFGTMSNNIKFTKLSIGTSQYFRKVIASNVGESEHFDYKKYHFRENVQTLLDNIFYNSNINKNQFREDIHSLNAAYA